MSAPAGRHSLAAAMAETRQHRHDVLQARLDETGHDPVWLDLDVELRTARLNHMWRKTGPGRRDQWAAAIGRDLAKRDRVNGMSLTVDGVVIELAGGSAAEIVGREPLPVLVPPPPGLLQGMATEVDRAVREAEQVLKQVDAAVKAAPRIGKRLGDFFRQTFPREHGGDE